MHVTVEMSAGVLHCNTYIGGPNADRFTTCWYFHLLTWLAWSQVQRRLLMCLVPCQHKAKDSGGSLVAS